MYSRGDIDGGTVPLSGRGNYGPGFIPFPSESAGAMPELDQWTQEFRLASNGNEVLNWLAGFFYFNEEVNIDNFSYDTRCAGQPPEFVSRRPVPGDDGLRPLRLAELGGLGRAGISPAALRYSNDEKDFWVDMPQDRSSRTSSTEPITEATRGQLRELGSQRHLEGKPDVNFYGRLSPPVSAPRRSRAGSRSVDRASENA